MTEIIHSPALIGWAESINPSFELIPLGRLVRLRSEKNDPIKETQILSLTADRGVILYEEKGNIGNQASEDISRYSLVKPGDIVVNSMNVIIGSVGLSKYSGALSPVYYVLTPVDPLRIDMRFLAYHFHMRSFQKGLIRIGYGILDHRMRIPWINLAAELIVVPPIEEQKSIANYLDTKIGLLDRIISLKEQQLELLDQYWTTYLANSITDASYPEVPLKYFAWWQEGPGILAEDFMTDGVPIIRIRHLRSKPNSLDDCEYVEESKAFGKWRHYQTEIGDLIISASAASEAIAVEVGPELAGAIPYTGLIRVKSKNENLDVNYLRYFLLSNYFFDQVESMKQGIGIQHWGPSHLSEVVLKLPPLDRQNEIVSDLSEKENKFVETSLILKESINRFKQLRDSILTSSVTGQSNSRLREKV